MYKGTSQISLYKVNSFNASVLSYQNFFSGNKELIMEEEGVLHDGVDAAGGVEEHGGEGVVEENNVYPPAPELLPPALSEHPSVAGKAEAKKPAAAKKKRICKFPGCTKTVKAQGHCQRHGAKTKRCKVPDCTSQAQGSHDGTFDKSFAYYIWLAIIFFVRYNMY